MKNILEIYEGEFSKENADVLHNTRNYVINNMKEILKRNPDIDIKLINAVGIIEDSSIQFKIAASIKARQVVLLLGYLKWFWDVTDKELQCTGGKEK